MLRELAGDIRGASIMDIVLGLAEEASMQALGVHSRVLAEQALGELVLRHLEREDGDRDPMLDRRLK